MAYAAEQDVINIAAFAADTDQTATVTGGLQQCSDEIDGHWAVKGVAVPLTGPAHLLGMMRSAVANGTAALLPGARQVGLVAEGSQETNTYRDEYKRILAWIDGLTVAQMQNLGLVVTIVGGTSTEINAGLGLVGNRHYAPDCRHWSDAYPFRRG